MSACRPFMYEPRQTLGRRMAAMHAPSPQLIGGGPPTPNCRALEQKNHDNRYSGPLLPGFLCGDREAAQFASLALVVLVDVTDRLTFDFALATPHTLSRKCIGLSPDEDWIASLSRLVLNSDFHK